MRSRSQLSWNPFAWNVLLLHTHIPDHFLQTLVFVDPSCWEALVFAQLFLGLHHYYCKVRRQNNRLQWLLATCVCEFRYHSLANTGCFSLFINNITTMFSGSYKVKFWFVNPRFFNPILIKHSSPLAKNITKCRRHLVFINLFLVPTLILLIPLCHY